MKCLLKLSKKVSNFEFSQVQWQVHLQSVIPMQYLWEISERSVNHNLAQFSWVGAGYISGLGPVWSCCGYSGHTHASFSLILNPLASSHRGPIKIPPVLSLSCTPPSVHNMTCPQCPSLCHYLFVSFFALFLANNDSVASSFLILILLSSFFMLLHQLGS